MKKNIKKNLSISKVTITDLTPVEQEEVKGGWFTCTCPPPWCDTDYNCTIGCELRTADC